MTAVVWQRTIVDPAGRVWTEVRPPSMECSILMKVRNGCQQTGRFLIVGVGDSALKDGPPAVVKSLECTDAVQLPNGGRVPLVRRAQVLWVLQEATSEAPVSMLYFSGPAEAVNGEAEQRVRHLHDCAVRRREPRKTPGPLSVTTGPWARKSVEQGAAERVAGRGSDHHVKSPGVDA